MNKAGEADFYVIKYLEVLQFCRLPGIFHLILNIYLYYVTLMSAINRLNYKA